MDERTLEVSTFEGLFASAQDTYRRCAAVLDQAMAGGNILQVALAARETRAAIDQLARLLEKAEQRRVIGVVNILETAQWIELRTKIMLALEPYDEARLAVADSLAS